MNNRVNKSSARAGRNRPRRVSNARRLPRSMGNVLQNPTNRNINARLKAGTNAYSRRSVPSSQGSQITMRRPRMMANADGSIRICHSEPLGPVNGSVNFAVTQYPLNPGLLSTFPWLSQLAENYEAYKFQYLHVRFVTSSPSTIAGRIIISPDYNSSDVVASSSTALEQFQDTFADMVWADGRCVLNPAGMGIIGPKRYIRVGALAGNLDIKTYDIATVNIGTYGQANTNQLGELWLDYCVDLFVPTPQNLASTAMSGVIFGSSTGASSGVNVFGTAAQSVGRIGITNNGLTLTVTNLIVGQNYYYGMTLAGTTLSAAPTLTAVSGSSATSVGATALQGAAQGLTSGGFTATATTATFTVNAVTWVALTQATVVIALLDGGF